MVLLHVPDAHHCTQGWRTIPPIESLTSFCLVGRLVGWFGWVGWFVGQSVALVGWVGLSVGGLVGGLVGRFVD